MSRKKVVFIDWDGTLCFDRLWKSLRDKETGDLEFTKAVDEIFFGTDKKLVKDWMYDLMDSERANRILSEKTGKNFDELWNVFVEDCRQMSFDPHLRQKVLDLRKFAEVVLVTGNMDCFSRFTVPSLGLDQVFDRILNSSEMGFLKTEQDGETFLSFLRPLGLSIKDAYLVEDSEKTCRYFENLGGRSFLVKQGIEDTMKHLEFIEAELGASDRFAKANEE